MNDNTFSEFGNRAMQIRNAADNLTVKGKENASIVLFIYSQCNEIIKLVNSLAAEIQNGNQEVTKNDANNGS